MLCHTKKNQGFQVGFLGLAGWIGTLGIALPALAQTFIEPDGTLGIEETSDVNPASFDQDINLITGGAIRGQNLFHSFEEFSIGDGNGAYFITELEAISNIFARVTGGNPSNILGVLGTGQLNIGENDINPIDANLFLINPNGIVFGNDAAIDVGGSFTATTASGVAFGENGTYSAANPESPSELLTIDPSAYFFSQLEPGAIISQSTRYDFVDGNYQGLRVPDGETLTLLGGNVTIDGGGASAGLIASGGRIEIGAIDNGGTATVRPEGVLELPENTPTLNIELKNNALVNTALNSSSFTTGTIGNASPALNGNLNIFQSLNFSQSGLGNIFNPSFPISGGLPGQTTGSGITNLGAFLQSLFSGAIPALNNLPRPEFGTIIDISEIIGGILPGNTIISPVQQPFSPEASTPVPVSSPVGVSVAQLNGGGDIAITGQNISLSDNSFVSTGLLPGAGNAASQTGNVNVNATGLLQLSNGSSIASIIAPNASGNGGKIEVATGSLQISDSSRLIANTFGLGNSGGITVNVEGEILINGLSEDDQAATGIFSVVNPDAQGNGGNIDIFSSSLTVADGATLSASSFGTGNSGNVTITTDATTAFSGTSSDGQAPSAVYSRIETEAEGQGGNIAINTGSLEVTDGATLGTSTFGVGNAGSITIQANDTVAFKGLSSNGQQSSTAFTSVEEGGQGNGGNINIQARTLEIIGTENSEFVPGISSSAVGNGNAGEISIFVEEEIVINNGQVETFSERTFGGNITAIAEQILLEGNAGGDFETQVLSGAGTGGNITLIASSFIFALDDSDILASAIEGQGGNINLQARGFFGDNFSPASLTANPEVLDFNNRVDINAIGIISGAVSIPNVNFLEYGLTALPETIIPTDQLLVGSCIARSEEERATFARTGNGGIPTRPGDFVVSNYATGHVKPLQDRAGEAVWHPGDPIMEPTGVFTLGDGRLVLSRECNDL
jgi:filamentous hemagglutinin family protein